MNQTKIVCRKTPREKFPASFCRNNQEMKSCEAHVKQKIRRKTRLCAEKIRRKAEMSDVCSYLLSRSNFQFHLWHLSTFLTPARSPPRPPSGHRTPSSSTGPRSPWRTGHLHSFSAETQRTCAIIEPDWGANSRRGSNHSSNVGEEEEEEGGQRDGELRMEDVCRVFVVTNIVLPGRRKHTRKNFIQAVRLNLPPIIWQRPTTTRRGIVPEPWWFITARK